MRARGQGVEYFQGWADDVNFNEKKLMIEEATTGKRPTLPEKASNSFKANETEISRKKGQVFELNYDKLVIAVGCYSQTFGTPGVKENAFFLKDVNDARKIRKRILECTSTMTSLTLGSSKYS